MSIAAGSRGIAMHRRGGGRRYDLAYVDDLPATIARTTGDSSTRRALTRAPAAATAQDHRLPCLPA